MKFTSSIHVYGVLAQWFRVSACHAESREFESRIPRFFNLITRYGVDNVIKQCIICDKRDRAVGQLTCDSDKCKEAYRNKGIVKEN